MTDHQPRNNRDERVSRTLERAAACSVARAARAFREAGFQIRLGRIHANAAGRHRGIELVASARRSDPAWNLEASWHIAHAPGHDGALVVLNEVDDDNAETTLGFRPLANEPFDDLLRRTSGHDTGIGLFDAPRVRADGLLEVLGQRGVAGRDYQAMLRSLDSALYSLQPDLDRFQDPKPTLRFAVPTLVTEAEMYEASVTGKSTRLAETCYIALVHHHRGPRTVDAIGLEFITTYARMAAEALHSLPRLIGENLDHLATEPKPEPRDMIDAWDAFRSL